MTDIREVHTKQAQHFGTRLQNARESLHISLEEAAARLRLNPEIIRALETNDFKKTPPATFTRGYIRSYAKMLSFKDIDIDRALSESGLIVQTGNDFIAPALKTKSHPHAERYVHVLTTFIVIVLAGLVAIWWKTHAHFTLPEIITNTTQQSIAIPAEQPTPTEANVTHNSFPAAPVGPAPNSPTVTQSPTSSAPPQTAAQANPMVPVVIPPDDTTTQAQTEKPVKNARKKTHFMDIINTISEPGLEQ